MSLCHWSKMAIRNRLKVYFGSQFGGTSVQYGGEDRRVHSVRGCIWESPLHHKAGSKEHKSEAEAGLTCKDPTPVTHFNQPVPISLTFHSLQSKTIDWEPRIQDMRLWISFQTKTIAVHPQRSKQTSKQSVCSKEWEEGSPGHVSPRGLGREHGE